VLPPKPIVFYGREEIVEDVVDHLTRPGTARIAILGAGGMGKTTIALEVLYDPRIVERFDDHRIFQSCEALVDADSLIGKLAEQCGVEPTAPQLHAAVVARLSRARRTLLVIDNLETIWLVGGAPVISIDELLGSLAQIPTISLMINCRGRIMPQSVSWSNSSTAALEPFSEAAALGTFKDRLGRPISADDEIIAKELVRAVDMMPLAVTLLGQLAQRGKSVSELRDAWNDEHCELLQTHASGRSNNVDVSIELSLKIVREADQSQESLQLLSVCAILPDGLRPEVFEKLKPLFKNIRRARDALCDYALASLGTDRELKILSPIRHLVLERYPAQADHHRALCSIYLDLAAGLPDMDESYKQREAAVAPEMGNLSLLLLSLVAEPSEQVVTAVIDFTNFRYWQQPTITLTLALLPYIEQNPLWKAKCLHAVGRSQQKLGKYRSAIISHSTAAQLFLDAGDHLSAATCKVSAGDIHSSLREYSNAEVLLEEARVVYIKLGRHMQEARCRLLLGRMMRIKGEYAPAIEHLKAAQQTLRSSKQLFTAARCSESLGILYLLQGDFDAAATELEASRSAFLGRGNQFYLAQSTRFLGNVRREQRDFTRAEELLREAEDISTAINHQHALANCALAFGNLRRDQGRREEAEVHYESAQHGFEVLGFAKMAADCKKRAELLRSKEGLNSVSLSTY